MMPIKHTPFVSYFFPATKKLTQRKIIVDSGWSCFIKHQTGQDGGYASKWMIWIPLTKTVGTVRSIMEDAHVTRECLFTGWRLPPRSLFIEEPPERRTICFVKVTIQYNLSQRADDLSFASRCDCELEIQQGNVTTMMATLTENCGSDADDGGNHLNVLKRITMQSSPNGNQIIAYTTSTTCYML